MISIIGVRFKPTGKVYYFDPQGFEVKRGDNVIVETSRGIEYGEVVQGIKEVEDSVVTNPLKGVLRLATAEDTETFNLNKQKEKDAYKICAEKIEKHGLDMKLIEVEYTFDGNKILFYFTSDGRVDFRELVKDLASVFKTRIELRQIGVRDESKTLGSIGICGRNLCCSQFLGEFVPVSIKMAKEQGLSLNPTKISGACGRLMCCLKYEQDTYEALNSELPSVGVAVDTPDGKGTVVSVAVLKGKVRVCLENEGETAFKDFDVSEITEKSSERREKETVEEAEEETVQDKKTNRRNNRPRRKKNKNAPQKSEE